MSEILRSPVNAAWQQCPRFPAIVAVAAVLFATAMARARQAAPPEPLATQVRKVLGLTPGHGKYLKPLAGLVAAINGKLQPFSRLTAIFVKHRAEVARLVKALTHAANPNALRSQILQAVTLSGAYAPPKGEKWRFGYLIDRMYIAGYLRNHAAKLSSGGHLKNGARYARAALLLDSQEAVLVGSSMPLVCWVPSRDTPFKFPPALLRQRRAMRLSLRLTETQARSFARLYRHAQQRATRMGHILGRFYKTTRGVTRLKIGATAATAEICRRSLTRCLDESPDMHWCYLTLQYAAEARRQLNLSGHRVLSKKIKLALRQSAAKIKADRTMPKLERSALLRWIKEASI